MGIDIKFNHTQNGRDSADLGASVDDLGAMDLAETVPSTVIVYICFCCIS